MSNGSPPADVLHPSQWDNEPGALSLYNGARISLTSAVAGQNPGANLVVIGGTFTDELHSTFTARPSGFPITEDQLLDARQVNDVPTFILAYDLFRKLQDVRIQAREAAKYLKKYASPTIVNDLRAHMLSIEGYASMQLAEYYCSGIPLPFYNDDGSFTLTKGFSHEEILRQVIAIADSARRMAKDSAGFLHFASLVRAKAFMSLGYFDSAATAVKDIPAEYVYNVAYSMNSLNGFSLRANNSWSFSISNAEGLNGLAFISSGDPRTASDNTAARVWFPRKYKRDGTSPITIASGVEGLLISAETELKSGNVEKWLLILNRIRNNGIESISANHMDTVWKPGLGESLFQVQGQALPGLRNLKDPGSESSRIALHFQERAAWLFLTANRQADLRRLIRVYGYRADQVYPAGPWGPLGQSIFGFDVSLPVPESEKQYNQAYGGCITRDA